MKVFTSLLLAVTGLVLLALGTTAWAQGSGYVCQYDCTHQCGILGCYPGSYTCDSGLKRNFLVQDNTLYGNCVLGSGTCTVQDYTCVNRGYPFAGCATGCCNITNVITFCKC